MSKPIVFLVFFLTAEACLARRLVGGEMSFMASPTTDTEVTTIFVQHLVWTVLHATDMFSGFMKEESIQRHKSARTSKRSILLFLSLCLVWLVWSGHYTAFMCFLGFLSCLGVTVLSLRMNIVDQEGLPHHLGLRIIAYTPWLLKEIVISNLNVARCILSPRLHISPTLVSIKALPQTELGCTILANSITLTPGTITVRLRNGILLVHALTKEGAQALAQGDMNHRVAKLEGTTACTPSSSSPL